MPTSTHNTHLDLLSIYGSNWIDFTYDGNLLTSVEYSGTINQTITNTYRDNDLALTSTAYAGTTDSYLYDDDGLLIDSGNYEVNREASAGVANDTGRVEYVTDSTLKIIPSYTMYAEVDGMDYQISATSKADWTLTFNAFGEISEKDDTVNGTTRVY